jgi:hypothetical protein
MGIIYTLPWTGTVTAAGGNADLWEINPADDKPIALRALVLGQFTEVADAAEEGLEVTIKRLLATVTSGDGTAGTEEEMGRSGQSAGFTWEYNGDTVATTSGTTETLAEIGWINRQTPLEIWFPELKFAPKAVQAEALIVRLETTLADDMSFAGYALVEEL